MKKNEFSLSDVNREYQKIKRENLYNILLMVVMMITTITCIILYVTQKPTYFVITDRESIATKNPIITAKYFAKNYNYNYFNIDKYTVERNLQKLINTSTGKALEIIKATMNSTYISSISSYGIFRHFETKKIDIKSTQNKGEFLIQIEGIQTNTNKQGTTKFYYKTEVTALQIETTEETPEGWAAIQFLIKEKTTLK